MKLKKVLCMAALSAAVALSGVPVSGAAGIAHAEETQIANLEEMLRSMYALYTVGDYASMQTLNAAAGETCVEAVKNSGSDRYVIDIDGNTKAMLYVIQDGQAGDNWCWYFGQMENNLRQGNGTTIIPSSSFSEFTGTYVADMPNGNGKLFVQYTDGISYEISGNFQGAYLNGVYQVNANWIKNDGLSYASSLSTVYANNRFQSVNGWNLELYPYADEGYTEYYFWNDNVYVSFNIDNGSEELFAVGLSEDPPSGGSFTMENLDRGLDILSGRTDASTYAPALPTAPTPSPAETTAPTPEIPTVTTPAPSVPSGTYVVERGDNLSKIAQKVYGDKKLWKKIYDANSNVIKSDYTIWANQTLVIPQ